jgi:hypothetical protein
LTFCGGSNLTVRSYRKKSGRFGIGELFEAFQGVAHLALPVDFLEPFQAPGDLGFFPQAGVDVEGPDIVVVVASGFTPPAEARRSNEGR